MDIKSRRILVAKSVPVSDMTVEQMDATLSCSCAPDGRDNYTLVHLNDAFLVARLVWLASWSVGWLVGPTRQPNPNLTRAKCVCWCKSWTDLGVVVWAKTTTTSGGSKLNSWQREVELKMRSTGDLLHSTRTKWKRVNEIKNERS